MKQNYLTLFIFCLLLLGISSCQKEDKEIPDSPSSSTEIQLRSSNPFFQADFVSNTLGFNPRRDGFFEELEAMKASLALTFDNNAFLSGLPTENLYPCWDCAEPEYLGFANFYVPVYDIQANELKAIIIGQLKNQQYYFYYLNREVITQLKRTTIDGYISYWDGIFNYFDLPLDYSDRGDAFTSMVIPCYNSEMTDGCICNISSEICGTVTPDCSGLSCDGPGEGGEDPPNTGDDPIPFSDIFNWVRTWNNSGPGDTGGGGGGGSSSQGSNNSSETPPPWGGYGDLFDGSLPEDSGSNVVDEENGIITIMNPRDLYELQVENFINQYGLTPTVEEILALVPEACAVSTVSEVHNCIKYHLINHTLEQYSLTNLSDEDKWFIFNNFDIYQDLVNYLQNGGNSEGIIDRIRTVITWVDSVEGLNPGKDQLWWLVDNINQFDPLQDFLLNHPNEEAAIVAVNTYWGLAADGLLNKSVENIPISTLNKHINNQFPTSWNDEQGSLSSPIWFSIYKTQAEADGGDPGDWLEAIRLALKEGWETVIKPVTDQIVAYVESLGASFPTTADEWYVLASVMGPTLIEVALDFATDLIPIVGEAKSFARAFMAANNGNYTGAAGEFLGGIAGVIPIGDLIGQAPKLYQAAVKVFKSFKVLRALKSFSSKVFSNLKSLIEDGWKAVWDNGLSKVIVKDTGGDIAGEIAEDGVPNIIKKAFSKIVDPSTFKNLIGKTLTNTNSSNSISKGFINTNGNKFNVTESSFKSQFDDIVANGDQLGKKTENLLKDVLEDSGDYVHFDGSYNSGVNGFDGVFVKGNLNNPQEIIINESKQFTGSAISLSGPGTNAPAQMTDDWIRFVAQKLRDQGDITLGDAVENALDDGILTKVVTAVDRTGGQLYGGIAIVKIN